MASNKFLIVEDDQDYLDILQFYLETEFHSEIVHAKSTQHAIELLKKTTNYVAIICEYKLKGGKGSDVYNYLETEKLKIPFVLITESHPENLEDFKGKKLLGHCGKQHIQDIIGFVTNSFPAQGKQFDYSKISTPLLVQLNILPCDIYIKLSDKNYVKILKESEPFTKNDEEKYSKKEITHLYIAKNDLAKIQKVINQSLENQPSNTVQPSKASILILENTQLLIKNIYKEFGFTKELENLVFTHVDNTVKLLEKKPPLKDVIKMITVNRDSYISSHSTILPFIACGLAANLDWFSEQTFKKLALASLLHDITLQNDSLAKIETLKELELLKNQFTEQERIDFKHHPQKAVELYEQLENKITDVDQIILYHHEVFDGSGFPYSLDYTQIPPLPCLFIIAHALLEYINANGSNFKAHDFIKNSKNKFSHGYFSKIIVSLEKSLEK